MKKQSKVLKEIYKGKGDITVNELVNITEFTKRQVYNALRDLKNRRLIIKEKKSSGAEQHKPPTNIIYININKAVEKRIKRIIGKKDTIFQESENEEREKNG